MTITASPARKALPLGASKHLGRELVSHHPRIFQKRVQALEDVVVGAADADAANGEQHFVRLALGQRPLLKRQPAGLAADDGLHPVHEREPSADWRRPGSPKP